MRDKEQKVTLQSLSGGSSENCSERFEVERQRSEIVSHQIIAWVIGLRAVEQNGKLFGVERREKLVGRKFFGIPFDDSAAKAWCHHYPCTAEKMQEALGQKAKDRQSNATLARDEAGCGASKTTFGRFYMLHATF